MRQRSQRESSEMNELFDRLYLFNDLAILGLVWLAYLSIGLLMFFGLKFVLDRMQIFGNPYFSVTIIGTTLSLNAVLLIFVLIQSISTFQKVKEIVNNELRSLYAIEKAITPLSSRAVDQIRPQFSDYLNAVMTSEWKYMSSKNRDEATEVQFDEFIEALAKFTPQNDWERKLKEELMPMIEEAASARYLRIKNRGTQLSYIFFVGVIIMQFLFVLHFALLTKRDGFSQFAVVIYQSILGVLLGLLVIYDHPFQGKSGIGPDEFQPMLERVQNTYGAEYR